ncbi:MAG: helix-turn-helix domain-containing protein [Solirubrobacteraceae bacterium]
MTRVANSIHRQEAAVSFGRPATRRATPQERADAAQLRRHGVPIAEIAARYCVADSTVKMWVAAAKAGTL